MFCNFLRFDLKNGVLKEWRKFVIATVCFLAFVSIHYLRVYGENRSLLETGETKLGFTFADFILSVLGGMKVFRYEDGEAFLFPALWIFFFLLLLFYTLRYPTQNLDGIGKNMLILSQNRKTWWFSKVLWCCCFVLTYFAAFYFTAWLASLLLGGQPTLQVSEYVPTALDAGMYVKNPPWNILPGLVLVPCMACGLALFQMFLSICVKPIFAYVVSCILLLSSAYFASPFLIGNFAMIFRTNIFVEEGYPVLWGFIASAAVLLISIAVGYIRMKYMDILPRE